MPTSRDDLLAQITLTKDRITCDNAAFQSYSFKQFHRCFVFIGFIGNTLRNRSLRHGNTRGMSNHGEEVDGFLQTVKTAA